MSISVLPVGEDRWQVQFGDIARSSRVYSDKAEAIAHAKTVARNMRARLVVRGMDGAIQGQRFFGSEGLAYVS